MDEIIFQKVGGNVLLYLEKNRYSNLSDISRSLNTSYSYVFQIIQKLEQSGLVKATKIGREKKIMLTDKGREVTQLIAEIKRILKGKKKKKPQETKVIHSKLDRYRGTVDRILKEIEEEGAVLPKHARVLGRIRYLSLRARPKEANDKKLRKEILRDIESIIGGKKG